MTIPRGVSCPKPLLLAINTLVGDGDPRSTIPSALTALTNLLRDSVVRGGGPPPYSTVPAVGGACFTCATWFTPMQPICPNCKSLDIFQISGPSEACQRWLHSFADLVQVRSRRLHPLSLVPPLLGLQLAIVLRCWLLHLNSSLHRWTATISPSIPLIFADCILCLWNHHNVAELDTPPRGCSWLYEAQDCGNLQLVLQATEHLPPSAWLLAEPCRRCGRPQPLHGLLARHANLPFSAWRMALDFAAEWSYLASHLHSLIFLEHLNTPIACPVRISSMHTYPQSAALPPLVPPLFFPFSVYFFLFVRG